MFTVEQLAGALNHVDLLWSKASEFPATGVHHGYRQVTLVAAGCVVLPGLAWLWEPFGPVRDVWLSRIVPGGFIVEHVDGGPYFERWQLPFTEAGVLLQEGVPVAHEVGVPFQVSHHRWHSVVNDTGVCRVSLVVDRDVRLAVPSARFQVRGDHAPLSHR